MNAHTHAHIIHTHPHLYTHTLTQVHTCIYTLIHTNTHIHTHMCALTNAHTYTHVHIHTHMQLLIYIHISFKKDFWRQWQGIYSFSWDKFGIPSAKAFAKIRFMSTAQMGTMSCSSLLEKQR